MSVKREIFRNFTPNGIIRLIVSELINGDLDFGLAVNGSFVGFCTLGYADDCDPTIQNHKDYSSNARILSQVIVDKTQSNKGFTKYMLTEVLKTTTDVVYLIAENDSLVEVYSSLGFKVIEGNIMVLSH